MGEVAINYCEHIGLPLMSFPLSGTRGAESALPAPQIMPEASWMESDWSRNLRIADNYVQAAYGGIFVGLIRRGDLGSGQYLNHDGIEIAGNTIVDALYAPILVTSSKDVVIGGNTIRDCLCGPPPPGQGFK